MPVFESRERKRHEVLCWNVAGSRAVRMGRWKLVAARGKPWELYDMEADRTEMRNPAVQHPERVRKMPTAYEQWARHVEIDPNS